MTVHVRSDGHFRTLVAEEDGETLGTAAVGVARDSWMPDEAGHLAFARIR